MGADRFEGRHKILKTALSKIMGRQPRVTDETTPTLSAECISRLAEHILRSNGHLGLFEVELGDEATCLAVAGELVRRGCSVTRKEFKWTLNVTCTGHTSGNLAA